MKLLLKSQYSIAYILWAIFFGAYLLYPGKVNPFSMTGFYLTLFFCLFFLLFNKLQFKNVLKNETTFTIPQEKLNQLNLIFLIISSIGLGLHLWDKIGLRGYNYFSCIDVRELWLADGATRKSGVSSWQSAFGHILVFFSVFPVIFSDLKEKAGKAFFSLSCIIFIIYCWTIVSRSSLLAYSIMCIASFHHFYVIGYISRKEFFKKFVTLFSLLLLFVVLTFSKKIACANIESTAEFVEGSMREHKLSFEVIGGKLGPYPVQAIDSVLNPVFKAIKNTVELPDSMFQGNNKSAYVSNAIPLYIGNGINNFTQVANKNIDHDYKFIFNPFIGITNRLLGSTVIEVSDLRRTFTQGFINYPGAVYLTFGKWGILFFPLIIGVVLRFLYIYSSGNILLIPLVSFLQSFAILAPLTNLTSNMSTPFLFFASIVVTIISFLMKIKSRR
ncbi:hypothetical protein C0V70_01705 [Bacteriovorax stolpii]|uniref:Uncharacterized protein n=1 Tax=Bacteriovorax stolpii TaxID=960 RepID=A0A2K9NMU4_BACTC|nr:hypothetical protein [Bacteriovorax stolpii]AUN96839.1 hypothetical protein C0V70_01705 [Bacteriovorax stolpii]TDP53117.1 hypothetical protein C8D79_1758 [Bacteriovorax stolpii]